MTRKAFYSFHYVPDNWRASQVRNMGIVEGNQPARDNDWETVTKSGDKAIQMWIDDQLYGRSVVVVLVGENTAGRKWINYEIRSGWEAGKGVLGIHIHNLKDSQGRFSTKGSNPFRRFSVDQTPLSSIVKTYDSPHRQGSDAYSHIKDNLEEWIEEAIEIRGRY